MRGNEVLFKKHYMDERHAKYWDSHCLTGQVLQEVTTKEPWAQTAGVEIMIDHCTQVARYFVVIECYRLESVRSPKAFSVHSFVVTKEPCYPQTKSFYYSVRFFKPCTHLVFSQSCIPQYAGSYLCLSPTSQ